MSEKELDICKEAIDLWGLGENYGMLSEESGELLSAVNKFRRGRNTAQDVITELADVSLIIKAFAMYFGYDKFIEERNYKLERLENCGNGRKEDGSTGLICDCRFGSRCEVRLPWFFRIEYGEKMTHGG